MPHRFGSALLVTTFALAPASCADDSTGGGSPGATETGTGGSGGACDGQPPIVIATSGACPPGYWLYEDSIAGFGGGPATPIGDGQCHKECSELCDCNVPDAAVHCGVYNLCAGGDFCEPGSPKVCCPPSQYCM